MKLSKEQIEEIEVANNVYIDGDSMQYNDEGREEVYGWQPIPEAWVDRVTG